MTNHVYALKHEHQDGLKFIRGQAEKNKVVAKVITADQARREIDCLLKRVKMSRD